MHQRARVATGETMRQRQVESFPTGHTSDLTIEKCNLAVELLIERVVGCHCTCPQDLLEVARWKNKRLDLIERGIPKQREADA
jgi:metal-dependent hydrolase (beta-lactamase superfamily II)